MLDLNEVKSIFTNLSEIKPLSATTGQREVCSALLGSTKVALKIFIKSPQAENRLFREVAAISKLGSTFVPKVIEYGKKSMGGEDRLFIIENWVDGELLADQIKNKNQFSLNECLDFCLFLLNACRDFESKNIVHRDIKPNNLMIGNNSQHSILDFGIVRHLDMISLTETAHAFGLGTFGYSAPEQMRNLKVTINTRADLFSVGVVIYEMLSGKNPYVDGKGGNPLLIIRHMEGQDLPRLNITGDNGDYSEFLMSLTERFPSRRPQTAQEAIDWFVPIHRKLKT